MATFILDIPHIRDHIVYSLSGTDLVNCLCVSRAWQDALVPYLWQDVVTFRTSRPPESPCDQRTWTYIDYFNTEPFRQALRKHAHHIHALTFRDRELLPLLSESRCTQLKEICFVIETREQNHRDENSVDIQTHVSTPPSILSTHGLDELALLVGCNPDLRAISIDNVSDSLDQQSDPGLMQFVRSLDNHPSVTCLHIGLREELTEIHQSTVEEMLNQRLDLIDRTSVHTLKLCRRGRKNSDRGLTALTTAAGLGGVIWPGRPCEQEHRYMGIYFDDAIAVILNDGVLEIILPFPIVLDVVLALFERYSAVHTLHIRDLFWGDSRHVLKGIPGRLPSLQYLDMDLPGVHGDELVDFLQDPRLRLSELKLWELCPRFHRSSVRPWLLSADSRVWPNSLHRTLTGLDIGGDDVFDMALLLEVLATCVNLQDLHAYGVTTDGLELETSPPWMCKLRELRLGIESYDERPVSTKFALSFMKQLGLQTDLSLLVLRFDDGENTVCDSPFLQLTVDRKRGLGLLSRLAKLETFEVARLALPRLGLTETAWMFTHWPLLRHMLLPVNDVDGGWLIRDDNGTVLGREFWIWLSRLQVEIGRTWHSGISLWGYCSKDS